MSKVSEVSDKRNSLKEFPTRKPKNSKQMNFSKTTANWEQKLSASFAEQESKAKNSGKSSQQARYKKNKRASPDRHVKAAVQVLDQTKQKNVYTQPPQGKLYGKTPK